MTDDEIVAGCEARGCCPLGAAMGLAENPVEDHAAVNLGIRRVAAMDIAAEWDQGRRLTAVWRATLAGLRPRIEAFLSGATP